MELHITNSQRLSRFSYLTFFHELFLKEIVFFPLGCGPVQICPQNSAPASSSSWVPEREGFVVENILRRGGVDREEKGKKDAQKKVGN